MKRFDLAALREMLLDQNNEAARRFYGMGFELVHFHLMDDDERLPGHVVLRARFKCLCGRVEEVRQVVTSDVLHFARGYVLEQLNFYRVLDEVGAMSREHLLDDGYTPAEIDAMEQRYRNSLLASPASHHHDPEVKHR